jgi:hypothetical protein
MKIIIPESQYNLLVEQIVGLEGLLDRMEQEYPQIRPEDVEVIEKFITDSNVGRILVEPIKMGDGLSLSDIPNVTDEVINIMDDYLTEG